jgi:lipopolysaccharide transport system ATP-binding protein
MSEFAIRVKDLGKRYEIGSMPTGYRTLRDSIVDGVRTLGSRDRTIKRETIWALRHISFDVERGHVLGIIGRNGAGKSTLLKLLSRVTEPTEGMAEIHGRVGSLLEVGTGFHLELTGRENIFLNGAILGMRRSEITRKFDEIVSFAEVEKFIDTPVKRYSSGMYLRLAFAVAAHLEPEILVVDEVLAVGDAAFQRKCLGKMSAVAKEGRTVLFVSHDMSAILRLTQEAILLDEGRMILRAPSAETVDHYLTSGMAFIGEREWVADEIPGSSFPFRPIRLRIADSKGAMTDRVQSTKPFQIEFVYELEEDITGLRVGLYISTTRGERVLTSFDTDDSAVFEKRTLRKAGHYVSRCSIPADLFNEGTFVVGVNGSVFRIKSFFTDEFALPFHIDGVGAPGSHWQEVRGGPVRPALSWEIEETKDWTR